ncbi:2-C-methyl-D-erythritol 4-phosphate cytidylyltransferase / 2-C-methyl-D-erythritol 2,4-cyclodiphosphate synthase [hydrothermal vent metagenome]|uniref:2-C-methyl-D-erythritol 2,4-cyclodiphosphate synthase n=1 Tax=hydrothermal vent metagenome TaxID=652676 RepID=A0A1W1D5F4_9ZZZZ
MSDTTLILLAAGSSSRFELDVKKQWLRIDNDPLWYFVADKLKNEYSFEKIIITASKEDIPFMKSYHPSSSFIFVEGSTTRQKSLQNALEIVDTPYTLVSDIARSCIDKDLIERLFALKESADVIVPYLRVTDTIVYENETINRDLVKRVQTPQLSKTSILKEALQTEEEFTDESSAIVAYGGKRVFVLGDENAHKITYIEDLNKIPCLKKPSQDIFSGNGFDVHQLQEGGVMWLGGIKIDTPLSFKAHSDGDVAIHALIDALLGASGMGDIGTLFPDNDEQYKGIDSKKLLFEVVKRLYNYGFVIVNVDITITAQKPRIGAYKLAMREVLASILKIKEHRVNVKATTTEKLGFVGREEGVAVIANANLKYFDWTKSSKIKV